MRSIQTLEEVVLADGFQVFTGYVHVACAAFVELYIVHGKEVCLADVKLRELVGGGWTI